MKTVMWGVWVLLALPAALVLAGQVGAFSGQRPRDLGVQHGRLQPPSWTRNSVSSQAHLHPDHPQRVQAQIDALALHGRTPQQALERLADTLAATPGITVVQRSADYLHAKAQTRWLGFVDDLEFYLPPGGQAIEVRSASRLGREDFGTNRARLERLRTRYAAAMAAP